MRAVFLPGSGVDLCPVEPGDGVLFELMPWRVPTRGEGESIAFTALAKDGRPVGLVRVEAIDWALREARLAARWREGAPGLDEALGLARGYAERELGLRVG